MTLFGTKCARIKVSRGKTMSDTLIRDNKDYGSGGELLRVYILML